MGVPSILVGDSVACKLDAWNGDACAMEVVFLVGEQFDIPKGHVIEEEKDANEPFDCQC